MSAVDDALDALNDEPETAAAAARRREVDEILARGPRDVVGLALDIVGQALYAQQANANRGARLDTRTRRKIERAVAAIARAVDAQNAVHLAILDLLTDRGPGGE